MRALALACAVLCGASACRRDDVPPSAALASAAATIDVEDPASCAACHPAIAAAWRRSLHARAHPEADPIYGGIRKLRLAREGAQIAPACAGCHSPRGEAEGRGVTCAACHNVAAVHTQAGARGAQALLAASPGVLLGPHDLRPGASPAHGTGAAPAHMRDGVALCMACHDALHNAAGVPICTTGPEHRAPEADAPTAANATCVSCHMPQAEGRASPGSTRATHASHAFAGAHHAWTHEDLGPLRDAVALSGSFAGGRLEIALHNRTGHAFPTGFPARVAALRLEGRDAAGAVVWQHEALLRKVYVDAAGQPTLAPWSERLAEDTRLRHGEVRTLRFEPPAEVARVEGRLIMRLLPPALAEKAGVAGSALAEPRALPPAIFERTP